MTNMNEINGVPITLLSALKDALTEAAPIFGFWNLAKVLMPDACVPRVVDMVSDTLYNIADEHADRTDDLTARPKIHAALLEGMELAPIKEIAA